MATFTVNNSSESWSITKLQTYYLTNITPVTVNLSTISISGLNSQGQSVLATVTGSFGSNGFSVTGTIRSISLRIDGTNAISATGLDVPFSSYESLGTTSFRDSATRGHDLITANSTSSGSWYAGAGNDTINPGSGNDNIQGGTGSDTLVIDATLGNSSFSYDHGSSSVSSADGKDTFSSIEFVQFDDQTISVISAVPSNGTVFGDTHAGMSRNLMEGTGGADHMNGLSGDDTLFGGSGADVLDGGSGNDRLLGGDHNDTLFGQDGSDKLRGDSGDDKIDGGAGKDRIDGGIGNDSLIGGHGNDRLIGGKGNGHDQLSGGSGRDTLNGGSGKDSLMGGNGEDKLFGGAGNDLMIGGEGIDVLNGGNGRDRLIGHKGDDLMIGGSGKDTFVFHKNHGGDTIRDFQSGGDVIEIGRGASRLEQLDFSQQQDDVLITFANVTILLEDTTLAEINQAENFLF